MADPSLVRFRGVVQGALSALEARRQEVNDLNVFPVADGDTGDNMALTLRAVLDELDRLSEGPLLDEIGRDEIVDSVARAALLGARGNSGVILSQLIRGAAEELVSRPGELVDPTLVGAAMARASDRAYGSVRLPVEGTILTVAREMASRIARELAHELGSRGAMTAAEQDARIAELLERALQSGEATVKRTPELLPALQEAGVVDAGGYALTVIFAGVVAALRGTEPPPLEHYAPARISHPEHNDARFRYCVNFVVTGAGVEAGTVVPALEAIGDSVLVVGDPRTLKVHVHCDEPERATGLFDAPAAVSHLDVADMREQIAARSAALAGRTVRCGVLAVCSGAGMVDLFAGLGVSALDGGPTLNPSTYDLLAGIHAAPAEEVVVLPNSPNVFMAAERAAELSDKHVRVVPSRSPQAGLAACVAADPARGADDNAASMLATLDRVRTGGVAEAARDDGQGRFRRGDAVGYIDEELVAWGEVEETLEAVLGALGRDAELVTCLRGEDAPIADAGVIALAPEGVEVEMLDGGQPAWWWALAAE